MTIRKLVTLINELKAKHGIELISDSEIVICHSRRLVYETTDLEIIERTSPYSTKIAIVLQTNPQAFDEINGKTLFNT